MWIHYVPSHVGLEENEHVDKAASRASKKAAEQDVAISLSSIRQAIKDETLRNGTAPTQAVYKNATGAEHRRPPLRTPTLTRAGATVIRQLRTDRHPLVWDYNQPNDRAICRCGQKCTPQHLLKQCALTAQHRPADMPSLKKLLFDYPGTALRYLVQAGLLPGEIDRYIR